MIYLVAIVTCKPGQRDAVLALFNETFRPQVLEEPGCYEFSAVIDTTGADRAYGPDVFVVIEKWESRPAVDTHCTTPHRAAFFAAIADMFIPATTSVHYLDPTV